MQLKKEAERAWDADKDKDAAPNMKAKNMHGSTKRVEQFRKNMRRWMIGESNFDLEELFRQRLTVPVVLPHVDKSSILEDCITLS